MGASVLKPDGSLNVRRIGQPRDLSADLYHFILSGSWWQLLAGFAIIYLAINLVFAALFLLGGDCISEVRPGSFADAFFFSVQSLSTIGYGGMAPTTTYAHLLVSVEAFVGMLNVALMTGSIFAKFSRPRPRVSFTERALISQRDGKPSFIFRMINARNHGIVSAEASVTLLLDDHTEEGEELRRMHNLPLRVPRTPLFSMSWVVSHAIDEESPLYGLDQEDLKERKAMFVVNLAGTDETLSSAVHSRHTYQFEDLHWGGRFADLLSTNQREWTLDYGQFDQIVES